ENDNAIFWCEIIEIRGHSNPHAAVGLFKQCTFLPKMVSGRLFLSQFSLDVFRIWTDSSDGSPRFLFGHAEFLCPISAPVRESTASIRLPRDCRENAWQVSRFDENEYFELPKYGMGI